MTIRFYINYSPANKIGKDLRYYGDGEPLGDFTGDFLEDTSYKTPSIEIAPDIWYNQLLTAYNYVYIVELNAYYFITDKVIEENNIIRFNLELDPLETYKSYILKSTGRAESYQNSTEKDINNNTITNKESGFTKIVEYPRDFTQSEGFILLTAGPGLGTT